MAARPEGGITENPEADARLRPLHVPMQESEAWLNLRFDSIAPVDFAPRMTAPLLVLHAPDDREMLYEEGVELASRWPNAILQPAEGRGHMRILSDSECVSRAVAFLRG